MRFFAALVLYLCQTTYVHLFYLFYTFHRLVSCSTAFSILVIYLTKVKLCFIQYYICIHGNNFYYLDSSFHNKLNDIYVNISSIFVINKRSDLSIYMHFLSHNVDEYLLTWINNYSSHNLEARILEYCLYRSEETTW